MDDNLTRWLKDWLMELLIFKYSDINITNNFLLVKWWIMDQNLPLKTDLEHNIQYTRSHI